MIVHALAFTLYVVAFFLLSLITKFDGTDDKVVIDYTSWFVTTIFGFASYICLFFVIWHLGATEEDPSRLESEREHDSLSERTISEVRTLSELRGHSNGSIEEYLGKPRLISGRTSSLSSFVSKADFDTRIWA